MARPCGWRIGARASAAIIVDLAQASEVMARWREARGAGGRAGGVAMLDGPPAGLASLLRVPAAVAQDTVERLSEALMTARTARAGSLWPSMVTHVSAWAAFVGGVGAGLLGQGTAPAGDVVDPMYAPPPPPGSPAWPTEERRGRERGGDSMVECAC